jgi:hypothetical protein
MEVRGWLVMWHCSYILTVLASVRWDVTIPNGVWSERELRMSIFWDITPCKLAKLSRRFALLAAWFMLVSCLVYSDCGDDIKSPKCRLTHRTALLSIESVCFSFNWWNSNLNPVIIEQCWWGAFRMFKQNPRMFSSKLLYFTGNNRHSYRR